MAGVIPHILGRSGDLGDYGGLCFAAIFIVAWVVKAVSDAVKAAAQQAVQRDVQRKIQNYRPPPMPPMPNVGRPGSALQVGPTRTPAKVNEGTARAKGAKRRVQPATPPPLPSVANLAVSASAAPAAPFLGAVQRATPAAQGSRPQLSGGQIAEAMRRRIIWAEVLGKPLALRDDHDRSI